MLKLPYNLLPQKLVARASRIFLGLAQKAKPLFPFLGINLRQADIKVDVKEYIATCIASTLSFFIIMGFFISLIVSFLGLKNPALTGFVTSAIFSSFVFIQQIAYPKLYSRKKIKSIEKNLIPALQNILVQLNSGIPTFNILINIANGDYGDISKEFAKAVKEINTGRPQVEALEEIATNNPSPLFRRAVWQIVNGMKAGSDMASVVSEIINNLSEQQMIQIQNYGGQLNPIAMFYMLVAVIVPSLSITFIIILSSFLSFSEDMTKAALWGLLVFVVFIQIIFSGIIKSRRPNLLND